MTLSIIIIGDEILLGQVSDTNSRAIARTFTALGWEVCAIRTVGDDAAAISDAVRHAVAEADLVITTGGLGPTKDDITKRVLTDIFGGGMRLDSGVTENIERIFALKGLQLNDLTRQQALVPENCRVIQNRFGTAPVMWFENAEGKVLVSMPGVPFETEGMLSLVPGGVAEAVKLRFNPDLYFRHRSLMAGGISESALAERLEEFEMSLPENLHLAYLPQPGLIRLRLDGRGNDAARLDVDFDDYFVRLRDAVGEYTVYDGDASAAEILIDALRRRGLTMASAESCTGGNIAHAITSVSGCSDVFRGSVVSYANDVKTGVLGVDAITLATDGAVSEATVRQMAAGACRVCGADCAVATSGIAGPGGAVPGKPVGTVWIAVAAPDGSVTASLHRFPGDRSRVIERATTTALLSLAAALDRSDCCRK